MPVHLRVFDDELLSCSKNGTVWGRVYFDLGAGEFPERGWSDMAVVFVDAWLHSLAELGKLNTANETVYFLDGPASVDARLSTHGMIHLDFIHKDSAKYSFEEPIGELLQDAILTASSLLRICENHGWSHYPDTQKLTLTVRTGREVLANLRRPEKKADSSPSASSGSE